MEQDELIIRKDGRVMSIIINREGALNALNANVLERLAAAFEAIRDDKSIGVVIITGSGEKAFVAGADVREIKDAGANGRTAFIKRGQDVLTQIRTSPKIVIAAINGYALGGGCELALACDIRIASDRARMGMPEATIGVMAGYGGSQLLARLVHGGMARYLIFSGSMVTAGEALGMGLVEKVCPADSLMREVTELARRIASAGPVALECSKRAIEGGMSLPLKEALELELREYDKVARSGDAEEGLSAFLEKRKPVFSGT
jgi:enoyl-CoA hydratase